MLLRDSVPLRSTPAPPTATSAGLGASSHPSLMPAGPSPYTCPGVDKPSEASLQECVEQMLLIIN